MTDLKLDVPVNEQVTVDAQALRAIDRGLKGADEGRTAPIEEIRKLIPEWISKLESRKRP